MAESVINSQIRRDPQPRTGAISGRGEVTDAVRVQILATEHWSLLATRNMTWTEVFSRATMFITVLSAAVVALALVAQATGFGPGFRLFGLLVLPIVLLVGMATFLRLSAANSEDIGFVIGMNLLRHAYLELAPELEPYFITGHNDDLDGIALTMGMSSRVSVSRILGGTPVLVAAVNVVVFGVIAALIAEAIDTTGATNEVFVGVLAAIVAIAVHGALTYRSITRARRSHQPRFPGTIASGSGHI